MKEILSIMRIEQWIKNAFVFVPIFFAAQFLDIERLLHVFIGFIAFCFLSSSVYIINDYVDVEEDRLHPLKKNRPLASGALSKNNAIGVLIGLLILSLSIGFYLGTPILFIMLGYLVLNLAYSFKLKQIAIVDVTIIAIGFLLRIFAGGALAKVPISDWLVVLTFLLAMILALGKRRGELLIQKTGSTARKSLKGYNLAFIDTSIIFMSAITVVSYLMYTISEEVVTRMGSDRIYFTTVFVILGLMRYLQQSIVFHQTESPTKFLLTDHFVQIVLVLWVIAFAYILYL